MYYGSSFLDVAKRHASARFFKSLAWISATALLATLTACGGSSSSPPASAPTATPGGTAASAPTATLGGIAAVGAPVSGGNVQVQCAAGANLSTTTASSGAWSVNISGQTFPCVITVSGGNTALTIHSVATGTGTVNVTPLTDLIVAAAAGGDPTAWLSSSKNNFASALATLVSRLATAQVTINANFAAAGYNIPAGDSFTASFTPTAGDPFDDLLEKIKASLDSSGLSYAELVATVGAAGTGTATLVLPNTTVITSAKVAAMPQLNSASLAISANVLFMKTYTTTSSPVGAYVGGGNGNKALLQLPGLTGMKLKDFVEMKMELKNVSALPKAAGSNVPPYLSVNVMIDLNCNQSALPTNATIADARSRHRLLTFDPFYEFIQGVPGSISPDAFKTITFTPNTRGWRISGGAVDGDADTGVMEGNYTGQETLTFNFTQYPDACIVDGVSADGGLFRDKAADAQCNTSAGLATTAPASCGKAHTGVFVFVGDSGKLAAGEWLVRKLSINKGVSNRSFTFN